VQYNNAGAFGGDSTYTFNSATKIVSVKYIQADAAAAAPTLAEGLSYYDSAQHSLAYFNDTQKVHIGQETVVLVRNSTGSSIAAVKAVYITGATGFRPNITLATNATTVAYETIGITVLSIANNADGYIVTNGVASDVDTSAWTAGDNLWLSTAGAITNVRPSNPTYQIKIGVVARSHATLGKIVVAIQQQPALSNNSDITLSGLANNDLLQYNGSVWVNRTLTAAGAQPVTLGAIGASANANGATLTSQVLNLEPASASFGGVVTTGVQSFAGAKTFTGAISASNLSGTNTGDQTITLTGNVTGSGTGSFATTIATAAVTLAMQADVATSTVFYRKTAGTGAPEVQTLATLKTDLGLTGTNSGDQTITLTGNVTGSGTGSFATTIAASAVTLAMQANVATSTVFYRKTAGTGAPEVQTLATLKTDLGLTGTNSGDQTITLTGDVTGSGVGSFAATIANDAVTFAKLQNITTSRLLGRTTAASGDCEELTVGTGLSLAAGSLTCTVTSGSSAVYAKIANATAVAITAATSATLNRRHVVSGTAGNYDITISGLTPSTGDVLCFYVKDNAAANKTYRLDAGGTVKIAGRTRYLTLVHTNVVYLEWDGTDWQPLVLNLDSPWIDSGACTLTAVTTNPTKGTGTTVDSVFWRRVGMSLEVRYSYRHTIAGANGSGEYLWGLPIGVINTTYATADTTAYSVNIASLSGLGYGFGDINGTGLHFRVQVYDTTRLRVLRVNQDGTASAFVSSTAGLANATCRWQFTAMLPITDW
jgi:hypothetical protein